MSVKSIRVVLWMMLVGLGTVGLVACSNDLTAQGGAGEVRDARTRVMDEAPIQIPGGGSGVGPKASFYGVGGNRKTGTATAEPIDSELWIIQKFNEPAKATTQPDEPKSGALVVKRPGPEGPGLEKAVGLPLTHTDVRASIAGYIATTEVTQKYQNPYAEKIEAVYVFPLPHNSAVNEFVMTIGDRQIRGIVREKEEAKKIYDQAKSAGYRASLMTQQRPNVFTQSVANIEPGQGIDISIKYFNTLAYVDGWYEYVFPMVVGPRFNPPGTTDGIGAVGFGDRGASGQSTEIQYLKPEQRSGHDIAVNVSIDAGVKIEQVTCGNHEVAIKNPRESVAEVSLTEKGSIPNRDFVLQYKVAGETIKQAIMTQRTEKGSYYTLMLYPPANLKQLKRQPLEMYFTLDVSGSMSGKPIEQAKAAINYALRNMDERDTFQIVLFASAAQQFAQKPVPVTKENIERALKFMEQTNAGGGTMMIEGIKASLDAPKDEARLRFVSFLTDGFIGNESEILGAIHKSVGPSRIFSFGVGSSVNRYLLDHMAKVGRGAIAYLSLNDNAEDVMEQFFQRIAHPALVDVSIDYGAMKVSENQPAKVSDLFVGRPVIVTGKFEGTGETTIKVSGTIAGQKQEISIPVNLDDASANHKGIASVWARQKIAEIGDRMTWDAQVDASEIRTTALEYGLMSQFTSFVAVDASQKTAGEHGTTIAVPVPMPDGVKYETTVKEGIRE